MIVYVVGRQRSGTTAFRKLLCSGNGFDADEILHGEQNHPCRFFSYVAERTRLDPGLAHPAKYHALFLDFAEHLGKRAGDKVPVADLKYGDLALLDGRHSLDYERPLMLSLVAQTASAVVHVIRRNCLRALISEAISNDTGVWSITADERPQATKSPVRIDCDGMLAQLRIEERRRDLIGNWLTSLPGARELAYEQMFTREGEFSSHAIALSAELVGGDPPAHPATERVNPEPLDLLVENFSELAHALSRTRWGWMLEG